jgi:hypothetical protein
MRKIIIAVASLLALAIPAAGIAGVSFADGVGHVDKGDVQSALKWNNGDFDKNVGNLTFFAGTVTKVYNNSWICQDGTSYNQPRTQVLTQTLNANPVMSSNGKQITGWDLDSTVASPSKVLSDTGIPALCPGSHVDILASYFSPAGLAVNTPASTTVAPGGLQVTFGGVTVALPNTPVSSV